MVPEAGTPLLFLSAHGSSFPARELVQKNAANDYRDIGMILW
jgi:hypothetical protein